MFVVLSNRAIYCGRPDDPATEQRYHQAIAEWLAAGRQAAADPNVITVKELIARFWIHAETYYRHLTDGKNKEHEQFRLALRPLSALYAATPATEFGPRALKAVQQKMVQMGWCRPYTNKQINRIRQVFKWAVSDELIPSHILHGLQSVPGLNVGRSDAREPEKITPVPIRMVQAIKPHVARQIWAMIQLQLFTAARPGEIARLTPGAIDRDHGHKDEDYFFVGDHERAEDNAQVLKTAFTSAADTGKHIWVYKLNAHKTAHRGFSKKVWIGPRAQQILTPFLLRDPSTYCFPPTEAETERRRQLTEKRTTPLAYGNSIGTNRKASPTRTAGNRYTTDSYRRAIQRGCDLAYPPPTPLARRKGETKAQWQSRLTPEQKAELKAWQKKHRWHPHQLRHNAATYLRKEFGLEAARIILGHQSTAVTEIYAEKDEQQAVDAIMKIG